MTTAIRTESTANSSVNTSSQQLGAALSDGLQQLVDEYHLKRNLISRHQAAIKDLLISNLCSLPQLPEPEATLSQPWGWRPGIESPDLAVGTLTVKSDQDIPLHDHPGSTGLLLVLSGRVQIKSYRMLGKSYLNQQPPLELGLTNEQVLSVGQFHHFGSSTNNIHTLHAIEGECVLFDVLFSPYQLQQRSFYMPVGLDTGSNQLFVTRLNKLRNAPKQ